jgi:hypothetical protein
MEDAMNWIDDKIVGAMIAITNGVTWLICPQLRKTPDWTLLPPESLDSAEVSTGGRVLQFKKRD